MKLLEIPNLQDHHGKEFLWDRHPTDPMSCVVYHWGKPVMSFFLGEAMESAGYRAVMEHVRECNNSLWLRKWQDERNEELIELLVKDYS